MGDLLGIGGDLAEKVDRIEAKQATSLDQLQALARKALETKKKVEEMYYFKRQSQQRAEELAGGLKQHKPRKLYGRFGSLSGEEVEVPEARQEA